MNRKIQQGLSEMSSVFALITKDLKKKAKSFASLDEMSLTELIEKLLTDYVKKETKKTQKINVITPETAGK